MHLLPTRLRPWVRTGTIVLSTLLAVISMTGTALASLTTHTSSPQNVTSSSATLLGAAACPSGKTCTLEFRYKSLSNASWQQTAAAKYRCTSSSTCSSNPSAPVRGLASNTGYEYQLCRVGKQSYCFGPDGTANTVQQFTTAGGGASAPTNTALPTVSGPAQQGSVLTESHGSWSGSPTSYSYQWQDCNSSATSCVDIPGATAQTYTLAASDVGYAIVVTETAANGTGSASASSAPTALVGPASSSPPSAGVGDGTTGNVTFAENFQNPVAATGYDPQALNYPAGGAKCIPFGSGQKCPGDWYTQPGGYFGVVNSADLHLPSSSQCGCAFEWVMHGGPRAATNEVGTTTYHSMAFYVPSSCSIPGGYTEIQELHFTNDFNGAPVRFEQWCDHVTIQLDVGQCVQGSHCADHSNADAPGAPTGSTELPGLYAIPPGAITPGAWNEIVVRVNWETSNTGSITSWYRSYNPTTGVHTTWQSAGSTCTPSSAGLCGSLTGIPTTQWVSGGQPPRAWNDGPESYKFASSTSLDTYVAGYSEATGFQAAASVTP